MRIDLFLRVSGILKTRTLAGLACDGGHVMLNGRVAKASAQVRPGDRIDMEMPDGAPASFIIDAVPETRQVRRSERASLMRRIGGGGDDDPV
jgi:ribosomal 50S subunit-recycling heat shock protein